MASTEGDDWTGGCRRQKQRDCWLGSAKAPQPHAWVPGTAQRHWLGAIFSPASPFATGVSTHRTHRLVGAALRCERRGVVGAVASDVLGSQWWRSFTYSTTPHVHLTRDIRLRRCRCCYQHSSPNQKQFLHLHSPQKYTQHLLSGTPAFHEHAHVGVRSHASALVSRLSHV
jgi:hypothetical protein